MTTVFVILILGGMAFVSYFMHAVYEQDEDVLDARSVPQSVRSSFESRFPSASDVEWEFDEGLYDVEFSWQGHEEMEASFEADGTWVSSETFIEFSELPERAQAYVHEQDGYEIDEIAKIERNGQPPVYEVELESTLRKWECIFDTEGRLVTRDREGPILEGHPDD